MHLKLAAVTPLVMLASIAWAIIWPAAHGQTIAPTEGACKACDRAGSSLALPQLRHALAIDRDVRIVEFTPDGQDTGEALQAYLRKKLLHSRIMVDAIGPQDWRTPEAVAALRANLRARPPALVILRPESVSLAAGEEALASILSPLSPRAETETISLVRQRAPVAEPPGCRADVLVLRGLVLNMTGSIKPATDAAVDRCSDADERPLAEAIGDAIVNAVNAAR